MDKNILGVIRVFAFLTLASLVLELMFIGSIVESHKGRVIEEQNLFSATLYPMRVELEDGSIIAVGCSGLLVGSSIVVNESKSLILKRTVYSCSAL